MSASMVLRFISGISKNEYCILYGLTPAAQTRQRLYYLSRRDRRAISILHTRFPRILREKQTLASRSCTVALHISLVPKGARYRRGERRTLVYSFLSLWSCRTGCRNRAIRLYPQH